MIPLGAGAVRAPSDDGASSVEEASEPAAPVAPAPIERTGVASDGNGGGAHPRPAITDAVTVTVPLRITVRAGNGSGRAPAVGVNLS